MRMGTSRPRGVRGASGRRHRTAAVSPSSWIVPGLVAQQDGVTVTVFAFDVADGRIKHIWAVRNPRNSGPGRRADARLPTIGSAESRATQPPCPPRRAGPPRLRRGKGPARGGVLLQPLARTRSLAKAGLCNECMRRRIGKRRRNKTTSTIMTMTTRVPIPIYMEVSSLGAADGAPACSSRLPIPARVNRPSPQNRPAQPPSAHLPMLVAIGSPRENHRRPNEQCSRQQAAGTTSQQRSTLPAASRGKVSQ